MKKQERLYTSLDWKVRLSGTDTVAQDRNQMIFLLTQIELIKRGVGIPKRVTDSGLIRDSDLPESEARKYINELAGLGLITMGIKISGADFRMLSITKEGIQELQNQEDR